MSSSRYSHFFSKLNTPKFFFLTLEVLHVTIIWILTSLYVFCSNSGKTSLVRPLPAPNNQ